MYVPRRIINTFKRSIYDLGILEKKKEFRESNPKTFLVYSSILLLMQAMIALRKLRFISQIESFSLAI